MPSRVFPEITLWEIVLLLAAPNISMPVPLPQAADPVGSMPMLLSLMVLYIAPEMILMPAPPARVIVRPFILFSLDSMEKIQEVEDNKVPSTTTSGPEMLVSPLCTVCVNPSMVVLPLVRLGSKLVGWMTHTLATLSYPGSEAGMLNSIMCGPALMLAFSIAQRSEPPPLSLV